MTYQFETDADFEIVNEVIQRHFGKHKAVDITIVPDMRIPIATGILEELDMPSGAAAVH